MEQNRDLRAARQRLHSQRAWLPKELRGTYAGLAHPATLSYLQDLGVTSIELLPIQAKQSELFLQERGRVNYWGYSTLGYFAPEASYAHQALPGGRCGRSTPGSHRHGTSLA